MKADPKLDLDDATYVVTAVRRGRYQPFAEGSRAQCDEHALIIKDSETVDIKVRLKSEVLAEGLHLPSPA